MFTINRQSMENITKGINSKSNPGKGNISLYDVFKKMIWNIIDLTKTFSEYEMAHWINYNDRWINNRNTDNKTTYQRSSIVNIDLGATNFRYEPSFTHPCIVLANRYNSILVVPCSSKKYGKGYPDIIDAEINDGFVKQTGIQIENIRWVHKNRVISTVGKASSRIMKEIDDHLLSTIPEYKKEKTKFQFVLSENEKLKQEIELLRLENDELKQEIGVLNLKEEA